MKNLVLGVLIDLCENPKVHVYVYNRNKQVITV